MRIVAISDTHMYHDTLTLPEGDLLVHAGDATMKGSPLELTSFCDWLAVQPHKHKIFVAGNHDIGMADQRQRDKFTELGIHVLHESSVNIDGFEFWGSPFCQFINDQWAFGHQDGVSKNFQKIPDYVDILITHGPPHKIMDTCPGGQVGSTDLRERVHMVRPRMHIFGHIHESYGREDDDWTSFFNVCTCNGRYQPLNKPVVIDFVDTPDGLTVTTV